MRATLCTKAKSMPKVQTIVFRPKLAESERARARVRPRTRTSASGAASLLPLAPEAAPVARLVDADAVDDVLVPAALVNGAVDPIVAAHALLATAGAPRQQLGECLPPSLRRRRLTGHEMAQGKAKLDGARQVNASRYETMTEWDWPGPGTVEQIRSSDRQDNQDSRARQENNDKASQDGRDTHVFHEDPPIRLDRLRAARRRPPKPPNAPHAPRARARAPALPPARPPAILRRRMHQERAAEIQNLRMTPTSACASPETTPLGPTGNTKR